jgi:hypothetical protein
VPSPPVKDAEAKALDARAATGFVERGRNACPQKSCNFANRSNPVKSLSKPMLYPVELRGLGSELRMPSKV